MKKISSLIIILFSVVCISNSQSTNMKQTGVGSISGSVFDKKTNQPMEYVTVALYGKSAEGMMPDKDKMTPEFKQKMMNDPAFRDSVKQAMQEQMKNSQPKLISGTITNSRGKYYLQNLSEGEYYLEVTFLGYGTVKIDSLKISKNISNIFPEKIFLEESNEIEEVSVEEEKSVYENKIDRTVYNAENDESNKIGTGEDVLRKVPMLSVDYDGQISLRGSTSVQVLVNGKPSTLFSGDVDDALKMIPASEIKRVEVITSPTAKYDAQGSAGIINIVTKKSDIEGFFASVEVSLDLYRPSSGLNFNMKKGRFSAFANFNGTFARSRDAHFSYYREDYIADSVRTLSQYGAAGRSHSGVSGKAGIEYSLSETANISSSVNLRNHGFDKYNNVDVLYNDPINFIKEDYRLNNLTDGFFNSLEWNTDFMKKFAKEGQELTIAFQYSKKDKNTLSELSQTSDSENFVFYPEETENLGDDNEYTFQIDYAHPLNKIIKIETGAKSIMRDYINNYTVSKQNELQDFIIINSDILNYKQNVYSGYGSLNFTITNSISLITGLRYEKTEVFGEYRSEMPDFENSYSNFIPNAIISKKFKNFSTLNLSYVQRLSRPNMRHMSPFSDNTDKMNIELGNPDIKPELSHKYELAFNSFLSKQSMLNTALYFENTTGTIQHITNVNDEGVSTTSYQNLGTDREIGLNIFTNYRFGKIYSVNASFNTYYNELTAIMNSKEISNTGIAYSGNIGASASFSTGLKFSLTSFFKPKRITVQGTKSGFFFSSFGVSKTLFKEKGSIGLSISNPFTKYLKFEDDLQGETFNQNSYFETPIRSLGLTFSYQIGKMTASDKKKKKRGVNNDDMKGDENSGGY